MENPRNGEAASDRAAMKMVAMEAVMESTMVVFVLK